jgi:hypothetical protein
MRRMIVAVCTCAVAFTFGGCFFMAREVPFAFDARCQNRKTLDWLSVTFRGFTYAQMEQIEVKRMRGDKAIDSFIINPNIDRNMRDRKGVIYANAEIDGDFNLNDSFRFTVLGATTFVLSDIKTDLHPVGSSFFNENNCQISSYVLDGKLVEDSWIHFDAEGFSDNQ